MQSNQRGTNKTHKKQKNIVLELKDKNQDKKNRTKKFTYLYFFVVLLILGLLNGYLYTKGEIKTLQYSEFKELITKGKISGLGIDKETIEGELSLEAGKKVKFLTIRVEDPELIKDLQKSNIKFTGRTENRIISTIISWVLPLVFMILIWNLFMRKMGGSGPSSILNFGKNRGKIYGEDEIKITFEDAAGVDEAKEELKEIIEYLQYPQKFLDIGGKIPKGILLVGPPGTGKTLLAKAVAGEAKVPFFSMSGSDFVEMFVGVGASRVRDLFSQAQEKAPCIIFIDELDAVGKARGINPISSNDEREQTLNQLLAEMDGFGTKTGVIIMGATNRPEILDPALLRPGRFDRHVLVDRPDIKGREEILMVHIRGVKIAKGIDLKIIAARTPGFVGADLANLVNESALLTARKGKKTVSMAEFEEAIDRVTTGLEKKKQVMSKKEKEIVAYHETGHALIAEFLETTDPVHKISIIPRGIAALGYTLQLPTEDKYLMTKQELLDRLCVLLGSRVAEEVIFEEVSTGAQNDLGRATDIAKSMVKEYGMSEKLGHMTFERERKSLFLDLGPSSGGGKVYSEETAREIDNEVRAIIEESYLRVKTLLTDKRVFLEKVAQILLEKESINGDELRAILTEYKGEHEDDKLREKTD